MPARCLIPPLLIAGCGNAAEAPAPGFADAILGRWDLVIVDGDSSYPSWLEIRLRTERELMAEFVGGSGSKRHASVVDYADGTLKIRIPVQYEPGGEQLVFTGTLTDGRLQGTTHLDDGPGRPWWGVRAPLLEDRAVAEWGEPIRLIGTDLAGWRPRYGSAGDCWTVRDGVLAATPPCVDLVSDATFDDFRVQLEFRYPPGSNSGVYLRGRYEVQIQDDRGKAVDPLRLGGIYGFVTPRVNAAGRANEWQSMDVVLVGRRVTVMINGTEIIRDREIPGITGGALDSDEGSPGPLMLQGDHGPIEYRNVVVTPAL